MPAGSSRLSLRRVLDPDVQANRRDRDEHQASQRIQMVWAAFFLHGEPHTFPAGGAVPRFLGSSLRPVHPAAYFGVTQVRRFAIRPGGCGIRPRHTPDKTCRRIAALLFRVALVAMINIAIWIPPRTRRILDSGVRRVQGCGRLHSVLAGTRVIEGFTWPRGASGGDRSCGADRSPAADQERRWESRSSVSGR